MADEPDALAVLARSSDPVQQSLIKDILDEAGIPFLCAEHLGAVSAYMGDYVATDYAEIRVPPEQLQQAKDLLCSNGVLCDVSERLLHRTLEEVVKPLLGQQDRDLRRLLHLATVNNKETLAAIYDATGALEGGPELLEDLFFEMARAGQGNLALFARAISSKATAAFGDRFLQEVKAGQKEVRLALLDVAGCFKKTCSWMLESVATALADPDEEIRDAAGEALFAVQGTDYGYDPQGPQEEREEAITRFRKATRTL